MLIIHRYIFSGLIPPLLINLLFLIAVFLMTKMLQITRLIVNFNVGLGTIGLILIYSIPYFLVFVLPMGVMLAILLTLMRMSGDNEITALKSGGVSLYRLLPPIAIFALTGFLATLLMTVYGMPQGRRAIKELTLNMLASKTDIGIKARTFNSRFKDVTLYVNEVDPQDRKMRDVFIEDRRNPKAISTIVAPEGRLLKDAQGHTVRLRLYNGMINQVSREDRSANAIYFATYDFNLGLNIRIAVERYALTTIKDEREMSIPELRQYIQSKRGVPNDYHKALIIFHEKFSIPAACLALGILAIPLGIELKTTKRSAGLGMGLLIFILYYVLMTAGRVWGKMGIYHPAIGLWAPNIVFAVGGIVMLVRAANERPTYLVQIVRSMGKMIWRQVFGRLRRFIR